MRVDKFTKSLLLLIAVFLGLIALRPFLLNHVAQADTGRFDYVKPIAFFNMRFIFLDSKNGKIWAYDTEGKPAFVGQIIELGKPLGGYAQD